MLNIRCIILCLVVSHFFPTGILHKMSLRSAQWQNWTKKSNRSSCVFMKLYCNSPEKVCIKNYEDLKILAVFS